jgi:hypothetical protein
MIIPSPFLKQQNHTSSTNKSYWNNIIHASIQIPIHAMTTAKYNTSIMMGFPSFMAFFKSPAKPVEANKRSSLSDLLLNQ